MSFTQDAIVIGGGSAGLTAAGGLAMLGLRVALVEARAIEGECRNTGCVPSKALIAAGEASTFALGSAIVAHPAQRDRQGSRFLRLGDGRCLGHGRCLGRCPGSGPVSHRHEEKADLTERRTKSRNAPAGQSPFRVASAPLPGEKFADPDWTPAGEPRAKVPLVALETLWFNTGTLCNLACAGCYIESSPTNDALVYLSAEDAERFLDQIEQDGFPVREIGFTGGEPFMNPQFLEVLAGSLRRGYEALVLTNAMKPMQRSEAALLALREEHGDRLNLRVSLDHYTRNVHEAGRGPRSWDPALEGLQFLSNNGFSLAVAGRRLADEADQDARHGYAALFAAEQIDIDAYDPAHLVLFPEMDEKADISEITTGCWSILGKSPADVMCATSRMVVHRKGDKVPRVVACTLIPYDPRFELGTTLRKASGAVSLNHPHCARFCVLGGASCSA